MTRRFLRLLAPTVLGVATALLAAQAVAEEPPKANQKTVEMRGRIVRTAPDQIIMTTAENKEVVVHTRPLTRFMIHGRPGRFTDLQVGSTITVATVTEGDRVFANTVTLAAASEDVATDNANLIEGTVVRTIGTDQVVVQGIDGTERTVFVDPATVFQISGRTGRFVDLRAGLPISIQVDERDSRKVARRVVAFTSVNGQIVRTVGTDQVIVRGPDNREVAVFVSPQTRFRLTPQGGTFADLRQGTNVTVFFNTTNQRNMAQHVFVPHTGTRR